MSSTRRRDLAIYLITGVAALVAVAILIYWLRPRVTAHIPTDFRVYRAGARAVLHHHQLNEVIVHLGRFDLPFTYPPFAALVFVPLALLTPRAGAIVVLVGSLLCLAAVAYLCAKQWPRIAGVASYFRRWQLALIIFVIAGYSEVSTENFHLGQINFYLLIAVLYDTLNRSRYTGILTGIAAGFKVTPGLFIVFMLLNRRWADATRAIISFAATILISMVIGPGQVWRFWTHDLFDTSRVGSMRRLANASWRGFIDRFLDSPTFSSPALATLVWAIVSLGTLILLLWFANLWWPYSRMIAASLVGICGLLVTPISWNHHFIWLIPAAVAICALAVRAFKAGAKRIAWVQVVALVLILLPNLTHIWRARFDVNNLSRWQSIVIGSSYTLAAVAGAIALIYAWKLHAGFDLEEKQTAPVPDDSPGAGAVAAA